MQRGPLGVLPFCPISSSLAGREVGPGFPALSQDRRRTMPDWQGRLLTQINAGCLTRAASSIACPPVPRLPILWRRSWSRSASGRVPFNLARKVRDIEPRTDRRDVHLHLRRRGRAALPDRRSARDRRDLARGKREHAHACTTELQHPDVIRRALTRTNFSATLRRLSRQTARRAAVRRFRNTSRSSPFPPKRRERAKGRYFKFPQKRWMRRLASSRSSVLVA